MKDLELEIKNLIVTVLNLEDIRPEDISSSDPLFDEGLGLDSIDGLELGMALRKIYGIKVAAVNDELREHFSTISSMARFVALNRVPS
jgi:acyl carrier protein